MPERSLVRAGREPDQEDIYSELLEQEHVRELKEDIRLNGGLIDPLIVRDGTLEVLEGNSRLELAPRWLYHNEDRTANLRDPGSIPYSRQKGLGAI